MSGFGKFLLAIFVIILFLLIIAVIVVSVVSNGIYLRQRSSGNYLSSVSSNDIVIVPGSGANIRWQIIASGSGNFRLYNIDRNGFATVPSNPQINSKVTLSNNPDVELSDWKINGSLFYTFSPVSAPELSMVSDANESVLKTTSEVQDESNQFEPIAVSII